MFLVTQNKQTKGHTLLEFVSRVCRVLLLDGESFLFCVFILSILLINFVHLKMCFQISLHLFSSNFFLVLFSFWFNSFCWHFFICWDWKVLISLCGTLFFQYFANTILRLSNVWLSWLKHFADVIWNVVPCVSRWDFSESLWVMLLVVRICVWVWV